MAIHAFAQAALAILGDEAGLIILGDKIVQVVVGFEDDVSTAPAISPARAALRPVLFALKSDAALPTMPGAGVDANLINKHPNK